MLPQAQPGLQSLFGLVNIQKPANDVLTQQSIIFAVLAGTALLQVWHMSTCQQCADMMLHIVVLPLCQLAAHIRVSHAPILINTLHLLPVSKNQSAKLADIRKGSVILIDSLLRGRLECQQHACSS